MPLVTGKVVAFDTETTGLHPWHGDRPYAISFCNTRGDTAYIEWPVDPLTREVQTRRKDIRRIREIISDPTIEKVAHNLKFDQRMLEMIGVRLRGPVHDTMFAAHVCNPGEPTLKLKPLADKYLDMDADDEERLHKCTIACRRIAKKNKWAMAEDVRADMWMPSTVARLFDEEDIASLLDKYPEMAELVKTYCIRDSERAILLHLMYREALKSEDLRHIYEKEMRLYHTTYRMESRGVRIDIPEVKKRTSEARRSLAKNKRTVADLAGDDFNPRSGPQKIRFLFGDTEDGGLGIEPQFFTPKGNPKTDAGALQYYAAVHPSCRKLVQALSHASDADRALGTYYQNYLWMAKKVDGMYIIHPSFNQLGRAITGRFSCSDPNLQNVPIRVKPPSPLAYVRGPFGPRPGYLWYHYDYSQIEARIFAEMAEEIDMLQAFADGRDVYVELVERIREITGGIIVPRQKAKNNFLGKLYGEGFNKLAMALGLEVHDAYEVVGALESAFPRMMPYIGEVQKHIRGSCGRDDSCSQCVAGAGHGEIVNAYGRRIPVPHELEYVGINYIVQSSAADLLKDAMIRVDDLLMDSKRDAHLVMTIHDELVVEIRKGQNNLSFIQKIGDVMADNEGVFTEVKTPVDISRVNSSWLHKTKIAA